ncbi:MAG: hypothetical protein V9E81_13785 [Marmoricola sp.]
MSRRMMWFVSALLLFLVVVAVIAEALAKALMQHGLDQGSWWQWLLIFLAVVILAPLAIGAHQLFQDGLAGMIQTRRGAIVLGYLGAALLLGFAGFCVLRAIDFNSWWLLALAVLSVLAAWIGAWRARQVQLGRIKLP